MNKDITLYLDGKIIEWTDNPDILLTYQRTDYTNPTVTKNMYSKTLTIEGTPNNNNIFNHIWNLDRVMDEGFTLFNPSQRVPFELYNNAEIVEKGYAKLDSITREGYKIVYQISLYGGLGSFFYSLAYDINTDKEKTLADLNYLGGSNPDDEFNFTINKDTIFYAWDALKTTGSNVGKNKIWDYINFIPCYNGLPEDFDNDRVLINTHGMETTKVRYTVSNGILNDNFPMDISDGESTFSTLNGYVTGKMMRGCDEWEMRDLRSYLQRPALSIKGLFDAVCNTQNNGGFNVVLDSDFFSSGNPYYEKAWMTLPMLDPETDATDQYEGWGWYKVDQYNYDVYGKNIKWKIDSVEPITGTPNSFLFNVEIHATITGTAAQTLYTSCSYISTEYDPETGNDEWVTNEAYGGAVFQVYGFKDSTPWYNKPAKCGSVVLCLASKLNGQYIGKNAINSYFNKPYSESDIQYCFGYWSKVSGSDYVWHNETDNTNLVKIEMETNLMSEVPSIGVGVGNIIAGDEPMLNNLIGMGFDSQTFTTYGAINSHKFSYGKTMSFTDMGSNVIYKVNGKMRSFQPVTKKDLLGGLEGTPCDWLLSYCKIFGLFIEKDKSENTIYIKMRNNWYENETVDLEDLIDRSKNIDITPLTFESKWYNFNYGEAESKFLDRYKKTYSQDFGKQLIDTKFNFDGESVDLLEETKFRNGLTALEKSNYFNTKFDIDQNQIPQCLFNWCTVTYYGDNGTLDINMCLPSNTTMMELNPNTPKEFYDIIPKLQFTDEDKNPEDGYGILVFFNGLKDTGNADYWITDDVEEMFIDSDNPCWLQTINSWDSLWVKNIAIHTSTLPEFNRYMIHNNLITADWDFGYTKELYVPYYRYDINRTATMYENFWKSYLQDLLSVNTRKVDCYVALNTNDVYGFMKKFYYWNNSIWVCTQVKDFDIALDNSTLCSFTKVNEIGSYLEMPTFDDYFFNFYRTNGCGNIPADGDDEELSVYFNLDSSSNWVVVDAGVGYSSFDGQYPTSGGYVVGQTIKATFMPNFSQSPRVCTYVAGNTEGQQISVSVWQDGYVKEKFLTVSPSTVVLSKEVISPAEVIVDSSSNWVCYPNSWVIPSVESGNSGTTTITVSATTNDTGSIRVETLQFNNDDSMSTNLTVKQKDNEVVTLEQNEIKPIYIVDSTGGNVFYKIVAEVQCQVLPQGNTASFAIASGQVTYNTNIQPTSGTSFWIHFEPNTGTVSRNASFYAYYETENGRDGENSEYQRMPVLVYDYSQLNMITGQTGDLLTAPVWHTLPDVDLSDFKYLKLYISPGNHTIGLSRNNITSALIFDVPLLDSTKNTDVPYYSSSLIGGYVNNDNRTVSVEAMVNKNQNDEWQIAFKTTSLYGTSSTEESDMKIVRIEGYYEFESNTRIVGHSVFPTIVQLPLQQLAGSYTEINLSDKEQTSAATLGASLIWTATTNDDWITILTPTGTSSNTSVSFGVTGNLRDYRTGYIFVTYTDEMGYYCNETIVINQRGTLSLSVYPESLDVGYKGGDYMVSVSSSEPYNVSMGDVWAYSGFSTNGMFTIHAVENDRYDRTMNVVVTSGNESVTIPITQGSKYANNYTLDYAPSRIEFDSSGGTIQITIRSDSDWTIASGSTIN